MKQVFFFPSAIHFLYFTLCVGNNNTVPFLNHLFTNLSMFLVFLDCFFGFGLRRAALCHFYGQNF